LDLTNEYSDRNVFEQEKAVKFEAQNPKLETISNDQISNVPNKRV
jgi:hypothetical protein